MKYILSKIGLLVLAFYLEKLRNLNMFKKLTFIMIILTTWGGAVSAQSIYADIASEMAKEGSAMHI